MKHIVRGISPDKFKIKYVSYFYAAKHISPQDLSFVSDKSNAIKMELNEAATIVLMLRKEGWTRLSIIAENNC